MRRRVLSRLAWLLLLYCVVFTLLVVMQFTRSGNFSLKIGDMLVSGRYSESADLPASEGSPASADLSAAESPNGKRLLNGRANVFFGGLEFQLAFPPDSGNGLTLVDREGGRRQALSGFIEFPENQALFTLDRGSEISFVSQNSAKEQNGAPELRISGKFADGVSAIEIPFRLLRSSVLRNGDKKMLNISYNENRYQFSRNLDGLEEGCLVLSNAIPSISYRVIPDSKKNDPADFILAQAETAQAFNDAAARWTAANFEFWGRNMPPQGDEDMVIAWCAEAIRRGIYRNAASIVPLGFSRSSGRTWESAVYQFDRRIGHWENEVRTVNNLEREKANRITRLLAEKDIGLFTEGRLIEFLAVRGSNHLPEGVLSFARGINPAAISLETSAGILEACVDMDRLYPNIDNPFKPFTEQVCQVVVDSLRRDGDRVFVFSDDRADITLNLRLGLALHQWGEKSGETIWAGLGRSIALSVISLDNGFVPAALVTDGKNEFAGTAERISSAKLYRMISGNEYLSHAAATGVNGIWAWTAASSVNITQNERQMDINIRFPAGETHYIMLRSIKPFPILQINEQNWRRAFDFESYYNASGWYYFEEEQTLILKIAHRSNVEHIRIFFVAPPPPPPPPPPPQEENQIIENIFTY